MTKKKKYCAAIVLTLLLGVGTAPQLSFAVTTGQTVAPDTETSAFDSPAEAQNAADLAEQAATSDSSIGTAIQAVEQAQGDLDTALQSNDPIAINTAMEALQRSESFCVNSLTGITGVAGDDINSMRGSGMEWGEIAHELGVQSGLAGQEHGTNQRNRSHGENSAGPGMSGIDQQELDEATARNMESGWSQGHGMGIQAGVHDPGTGISSGGMVGDSEHLAGGVSGAGGLGGRDHSSNDMGGGRDGGRDHGETGGSNSASNVGAEGWGGSDNSDHSGSSGSSSSSGSSDSSGSSGGSESSGHSGSSGSSGGPDNSGGSRGSDHDGGSGGSGDSGGHDGGGGKW